MIMATLFGQMPFETHPALDEDHNFFSTTDGSKDNINPWAKQFFLDAELLEHVDDAQSERFIGGGQVRIQN